MTTVAIPTATPGFFSARERLRNYVARALARLRAQEALRSFGIVLILSMWLLAICIFADRMFSLTKLGINPYIVWGGLSCLGIPYILWRTYSPRIHENLAAILADDRLGLHARLSSALTLDLEDPANYAFGEAFFSEALSKLAALNVEQAFPVVFPKSISWALIPFFAAAAMARFMDYQDALGLEAATKNKRKAELVQQNSGLKLEKALQKLEALKKDDVDEHTGEFKVKQLLQKADSIAKDMKESKRNPDDALAALSALKRDIETEREKIGQNKDFLSRLEKLTADQLNLEEGALTKEISEALKLGDAALAARQLRKLAQKMKDDVIDDPNKTDQQKQAELERLKHEIEKLAGALSEDEKLKEGLQEISRKAMTAAEFQSLQEEIKKQAEKQNKGNKKLGDDLEKEMNDVADEMERLDEENDEKLNEDEDKEDKELENLEKDVDDAMEGMNSDDENSDEQKQEGEQQQQGQGQQGQGKSKSGKGSKSRTDGKSVRAKSRKKGSSSTASGKEGRQGGRKQSAGQGEQGGAQQGHQPGGGDPSGGPGEGHRPYRDGDAQFESQKIKGQLQAGAITGLSHFRGQGAKGDAPQEFVKAMTAAEQDAASSLELERIPMDARETVKDYFRNVKEGTGITTPAPAPSPTPNK